MNPRASRTALIDASVPEDVIRTISIEGTAEIGFVEGQVEDPALEPQLIAHVTRTAVDAYQKHHPNRSIEMTVGQGQMVVEADRGHLEMLLDNLLTNATKYSSASTTIEVVLASNDHEASVTVLDRGIGIGDADTAQLFTAFYRTEAARSRSAGLGIGLAACKRVVESIGGRIWAAPRDGGGSEFGFALPLA